MRSLHAFYKNTRKAHKTLHIDILKIKALVHFVYQIVEVDKL